MISDSADASESAKTQGTSLPDDDSTPVCTECGMPLVRYSGGLQLEKDSSGAFTGQIVMVSNWTCANGKCGAYNKQTPVIQKQTSQTVNQYEAK